ncbi:hypothetical protein RI367_004701 [Sorochytrium milnesiophthora]
MADSSKHNVLALIDIARSIRFVVRVLHFALYLLDASLVTLAVRQTALSVIASKAVAAKFRMSLALILSMNGFFALRHALLPAHGYGNGLFIDFWERGANTGRGQLLLLDATVCALQALLLLVSFLTTLPNFQSSTDDCVFDLSWIELRAVWKGAFGTADYLPV